MRKDGVIRIPTHTSTNDGLPTYEDLLEYNYVMYKNTHYKDKWFYAYITNYVYVNDGMTELSIETDVFQTWQFAITYKNSFIEREHVSDDTIGAHTLPEGLETGEYTNDGSTEFGIGTCHAVVCTTIDPFRTTGTYPYTEMNSIPNGLHYFLVGDGTSVNFIGWLTNWAANNSDLSIIQSVYMVPDSMTDYANISSNQSAQKHWSYAINEGGVSYAPYYKLDYISGAINMGDTTIVKHHTSINGYTPKNKKLFVWPYNFMMVDNHGGSCEEYRYEDFSTTSCVFNVKGDITPGCSIKMTPKDFKGISFNYSESMNGIKLPIGSWQGDVYTNWLTQNAVNIGVNMASSAVGIGAGLWSGNASTTTSGILGIASAVGSIYEHSRIPNQVFGNQNSGDVTYSDGKATFTVYNRCIKQEYAQIIDNFFTMYGYKVNRLGVPNIKKRTYWDYIKCVDVNLEGNIPENDMEKLKSIFNNGCTFWHDATKFLDYSQNNAVVS